MKTKIFKSHNTRQYFGGNGGLTLCITNGSWRAQNGLEKDSAVLLFYGSAYGRISRQLASDILKKFRREQRGK